LGPLGTAATNKPIVPAPGDYDGGEIDGMIGRGNLSTRRKPPQCRFVHHKPHMLCPDENPGHHGGKTATNCLSYNTAEDSGNCVHQTQHFEIYRYVTFLKAIFCRCKTSE
jgi:hypothetical protein